MSAIFISHRNIEYDNFFAAKVHAWLQSQKGIDGFLDFDIRHGLQAGDNWETRIYAEISRAQVVIALISPEWLASDWCMSEARMARLRGILFVPCLIKPCLLPFPTVQTIDFVADETRAFAQLRQRLVHTFALPTQPYPGLAAFSRKDAAVFFGRDEEIHNLRNELDALYRGRPEAPRLLVVLGASGSGKSSLVRAGLLPRLEGSNDTLAVDPFIPDQQPFRELRRALRQTAHRRGQSFDPLLFSDSDRHPNELADMMIASLEQLDSLAEHALIVIDQAEQLLRNPSDGMLSFLRALLDRGAGRIVILATMRSDFLHELQTSPLITTEPLLRYRTFLVDSLPAARLGDVIRQPAKRFGVEVEEALIDRLKVESGGPDSLPLLAFFLREFWQSTVLNDGRLTLADYHAFGGFRTALDKALDRALVRCRERILTQGSGQTLDERLRDLFVPDLVSVREVDGTPIRRRREAAALTTEQLDLLDVYVDERLLVNKEGYVEVAHEALLRQWPDLVRWIERDREQLLWLQLANSSAQTWDATGRAADYLVHVGERLTNAQRLLDIPRFARLLTDEAITYLSVCANAENRRQAAIHSAFLMESRYLTDQSQVFFHKGDYVSAIACTLKALPHSNDLIDRPYFAPAEHLLWRALLEPQVIAISPGAVDALELHPWTNRILTISHGAITAFETTALGSFAEVASCPCNATEIIGFLPDGHIIYRRSDESFHTLTQELRDVDTPFHTPAGQVIFAAQASNHSRLVVVCTDRGDDWPLAYTVYADGTESQRLTIMSAERDQLAPHAQPEYFQTHARYAISHDGRMLVVDDGARHFCFYDLVSARQIGACDIPGWQRGLCGSAVFRARADMILVTKGRLGLRLWTNYRSAISLLGADTSLEEVHELDGEIGAIALNKAETLLLCLVDGDRLVVIDLASKAIVYHRTLELPATQCGFLADDRYIFVATPLTVYRRDEERYVRQLSADDLVVEQTFPISNRHGESIILATSGVGCNSGVFSWPTHRPTSEMQSDTPSGKTIERIVANTDESMLACVSAQGIVHLVELKDVPAAHRLTFVGSVADIGFDVASQSLLVTDDSKRVTRLDVATRRVEDGGKLIEEKVPSDDLFAAESKASAAIFTLANKLVARSNTSGRYKLISDRGGHAMCIQRGLLFLAEERYGNKLGSIWNLIEGRKLFNIDHRRSFDRIDATFSADGQYLAVGYVEYDPQDGIWIAGIVIVNTSSGALIDEQRLSDVSTAVGAAFADDGDRWACIQNRFNDPRRDSKILIRKTGVDNVECEIVLPNTSIDRVRFTSNPRFLLAHDFYSQSVSVLDTVRGDHIFDLPTHEFSARDVFLSVSRSYALCVDAAGRVERFRVFQSLSEITAVAMQSMSYSSSIR